ncbi:MAG: sulfate transporter [Planctomycetota bacterium]|nr:MAG: sulfate transporter [Planctomycetota bacterium]
MSNNSSYSVSGVARDLSAALVVFLVALPLCLGIALASGAPLFAGVVSGIIGGVIVGLLSGSHTSVSGPGNSMMAIAAAQIAALGSFDAFLLAVLVAGVIQVVLGVARAGFIAAFFPTSVIKGLLAAIGVILVLKQIPHLLGHDTDPEGEMAFSQPDKENTFSELVEMVFDIHPGAAAIGLASVVVLVLWDRVKFLKQSPLPAPLVVAVLGVAMGQVFSQLGGALAIGPSHLVQVPVAQTLREFVGFFQAPDLSQWNNPAVYFAATTIALVASLETLLNLEAVDKIDPRQRNSPPSRELVAQGVGNITAGMLGGIPVTSVIVRSSVNINAGAQTKLSAIMHGVLLATSVMFLPDWLNMVPLSCLAAILLMTGIKLASPQLVRQMWEGGRYQFLPFVVTVAAIVLTDLLVGILIGLGVSLAFILNSNLRRPLRRFVERHLGGEVLHIELANQVSFLNRAVLQRVLDEVPRGGHVLLDAQNTDYIDPDVLGLIRDFRDRTAPARGVQVSFIGFRNKYELDDEIQYVDYSTRELQDSVTPEQVLAILKQGHERFRDGQPLTRDMGRQVSTSANQQHPLAVVLSCIDSRIPSEWLFDTGVSDIYSIRVAGNIISREVLGSLEYGCAVANAKLILVLGHSRCGAVAAAVDTGRAAGSVAQMAGCQHAEHVLQEIQSSVDPKLLRNAERASDGERQELIDRVTRANVARTVERILQRSTTIRQFVDEGRVAIVGAIYDVATAEIEFLTSEGAVVPTRVGVDGSTQ